MTTPDQNASTPAPARPDHAGLIAEVADCMAAYAGQAAAAAREGRTRDALLAAYAMQRLLAMKHDALRAALAAEKSKRVHPDTRAAIAAAAAPVLDRVGPAVRALEAVVRARTARLEAIGAALTSTTRGPGTYTARATVRAYGAAPRSPGAVTA